MDKKLSIFKNAFLGICLLVAGGVCAQTFPTFTQVSTSGENQLWRGNIIWGDYDNDGVLEAVVVGTKPWQIYAFSLKYQSGSFVRTSFTDLGLPDLTVGDRWGFTSAWIDYDNDGWLDLVLMGRQGGFGVLEVYKNNGAAVNGTTVKRFTLALNTQGLIVADEKNYASQIAIADFDNDGYSDIVIYGNTEMATDDVWAWGWNGPNWEWMKVANAGSLIGQYCVDLYKNDGGTGSFTKQLTPVGGTENFSGTRDGAVVASDLDNDGYVDVLVHGWNPSGGPAFTDVYWNNGNGTFTRDPSVTLNFKTANGDIGVGDFNNDGTMDMFLTGQAWDNVDLYGFSNMWPGNVAAFYLSTPTNRQFYLAPSFNRGLYTESSAPSSVTRVRQSGLDMADLDSDGKLDMIVAGPYWDDDQSRTFIYLNSGKNADGSVSFAKSQCGIANGRAGAVTTLADFDNDGYLDVAIMGWDSDFKVYKNDGNLTKNTVPAPPTNLKSVYSGGKWIFTWDAGSDAETPAQSLRYNLYVKLPGGKVFMNIPADISTGYVKQSRHYAALNSTSFSMTGLPHEKPEWGVQSIDQGKLGSTFAVEIRDPYIVDNASKTWSEYIADYAGDIIFKDGGQLTGISGTQNVKGVVKVKKTFNTKKWYALGFPFNIASVRCDKAGYNYDLKSYDPAGITGEKGEYWLKNYNGGTDTFSDYDYGSTTILAGGYAIQFGLDLLNEEITFISAPNVSLSGTADFSVPTDAYTLTVNPCVINKSLDNDAPTYYYAFEYTTQPGNFGLITAPYTLKPFESVVIANEITGSLRTSMAVDNLTSVQALDLSGKVLTEYYNLQGMRVMNPQQGQIYIVKMIYKSGKMDVTKEIIK